MKTFALKILFRVVRRLSSWAWADEIATFEGLAKLKSISADEHGMDIEIQQHPEMAIWVAKCFAHLVASSPNYTEMKFDLCGKYKGKYEWMTVHIQKGIGKTPHELRVAAEKERDEIKRKIEELTNTPPN